ncbi:MAG TPA: helix-turn-helix domain-containing protein [Thermohalobaculum sp.]|nr:helix-turn-helix domain-containing protein [Thermohalobaculum sp.]
MKENHDYLWGADAIAKALGVSERQAYYLLEKGRILGQKVGARWVVSRAELDEFMRCDA